MKPGRILIALFCFWVTFTAAVAVVTNDTKKGEKIGDPCDSDSGCNSKLGLNCDDNVCTCRHREGVCETTATTTATTTTTTPRPACTTKEECFDRLGNYSVCHQDEGGARCGCQEKYTLLAHKEPEGQECQIVCKNEEDCQKHGGFGSCDLWKEGEVVKVCKSDMVNIVDPVPQPAPASQWSSWHWAGVILLVVVVAAILGIVVYKRRPILERLAKLVS